MSFLYRQNLANDWCNIINWCTDDDDNEGENRFSTVVIGVFPGEGCEAKQSLFIGSSKSDWRRSPARSLEELELEMWSDHGRYSSISPPTRKNKFIFSCLSSFLFLQRPNPLSRGSLRLYLFSSVWLHFLSFFELHPHSNQFIPEYRLDIYLYFSRLPPAPAWPLICMAREIYLFTWRREGKNFYIYSVSGRRRGCCRFYKHARKSGLSES